MARSGRRPGPTTTPEQILDAARALFAQRGYQGTTIRAVADLAGVNAALVHHYFGTKEQLFVAALRFPLNPVDVVTTLLAAGPRDQFAPRFVRAFVRAWRDPVTGQQLQAVVRDALSTEHGAGSIRELTDVLLDRISGALGVSKLRTATAIMHLIGLMLGSTIVGIEPLASASEDELVELVTPAITRYLNP
ncbi:MAG: TetR family transcriptional regulator [Actinomycetota bacterium]|nr:TetR family transcriptional regulator [Actinomycetota bacterium]